jgi:hypothetical protein
LCPGRRTRVERRRICLPVVNENVLGCIRIACDQIRR